METPPEGRATALQRPLLTRPLAEAQRAPARRRARVRQCGPQAPKKYRVCRSQFQQEGPVSGKQLKPHHQFQQIH